MKLAAALLLLASSVRAQVWEPWAAQSFLGEKTFLSNMTFSADLRGKWVFIDYAYFGSALRPLTDTGLVLDGWRTASDGAAAVTIRERVARTQGGSAQLLDLRAFSPNNADGTSVFSVLASGATHSAAGFVHVSSGDSLVCNKGDQCWTTIHGGLKNSSFHGAVELGNRGPTARADRKGGLAMSVRGTGHAGTYDEQVFAVDESGNMMFQGLAVSRMRTAYFPVCGKGCADGGCGPADGSLKREFDNSASVENDGSGTYNGVIGTFAFNLDTECLWFCTVASSCDGGYASLCPVLQ